MKETRYNQVAKKITNLIRNGAFKEGDRIPSLRRLSHELNVSINTVKEAYWKLEDHNYIEAIPQSGFYVKKQSPGFTKSSFVHPHHLDPQEVSLCRIYGAFQNIGQCTPEVSLGICVLDPELWPTEKMGRFFSDAIRHQRKEVFNYLMPPGYTPLREQIARVGLASSLNLSPDEIIITNGCHEAVFMALMVLCKPGDTVVFESPMYFNLVQLIRQLQLKIIEVPSSTRDGMNLETLEFILKNHAVKAVFSISNFNNPLGYSLSSDKKKDLVQLLAKSQVPLIEDDIYGDICFQERPDTCKSYDEEGNVILCSSFSKTLAPGLRIGWIVPGKYYDQIIKLKSLINVSTASINQIAVADFLKEGGYERHLRNIKKKVRENIEAARAHIIRAFPPGTRVTQPKGGLLLWINLPECIDVDVIYQKAIERNILIAPGSLFSMKESYSDCMRLNIGVWNERIKKAIEYLGDLCCQEMIQR